ncbi:tRNA dimethylallyltransferase [Chitinispirillum alkaliphilum]|nr:tRNA dimethylallyltransferase [Chitinispirillum alkaliphilum]
MNLHPKYNSVVVCGPTASGKTHLGVRIATELNGEILSVDSRQVYRGMDIGTGKDLDEYATNGQSIPYHLIDIACPSSIYTLYDFQIDFYKSFTDITHRKKTAVAVGGTGLYLEAVLKNYSIAPVKENVALRSELMQLEKEKLKEILSSESPQLYTKTDLSSKKRIVRAIEIARSAKVPLTCKKAPDIKPLVLYVVWQREKLRQRIERRLVQRLDNGMIDEVKKLIDNGITAQRLHLFGMEYRQICRYLYNEVSYDEMFVCLRQEIFHLAKRQDTWFRGMERRGIPTFKIHEGDFTEAKNVIDSFK